MKLATARINGIKAGVEWEAAERQFLAGDLEKALHTIDRCLAMNDQVAKSHVLRGRILMEMGKFEGALESLSSAQTIAPENVDAQYFMGIIAERQSRFGEAAARYGKAMQIDPSNAQYVIARAEMLILSNKAEEGEALLRDKAVHFNCNAGIRHALGQVEMLNGRFGAAVAMYTEARLLAPDDLVILEDLTRARSRPGSTPTPRATCRC